MYAFVVEIFGLASSIQVCLEPVGVVWVVFNVARSIKARKSNSRSAITSQEPTLERENETIRAKEGLAIACDFVLAEFSLIEALVNEWTLEYQGIILGNDAL
jgi:hypothetical protein